jgi:hypothetical protein
MTIRWYSDEDRQRMRDEKRRARLWAEFEWEYMSQHFRVVGPDSDPMTSEQLDKVRRLNIRPWGERRDGED